MVHTPRLVKDETVLWRCRKREFVSIGETVKYEDHVVFIIVLRDVVTSI